MEHHVARDLLAGYAEVTLEPETREAVEEHLSGCEECRNLLSEERPIALPTMPPPPPWTERRVVRTARRALFRAALYAVLFYLFLGIPLTALASNAASAVIDRNGRAIIADGATRAIASLFVPGGITQSLGVKTSFLKRDYSVRVVRRIGGIERVVGELTTRLSPFQFKVQANSPISQSGPGATDFVGYFNPTTLGSPPNRNFRPGVLPDGSVITLQLFFLNGLSLEEAQGLLDEMGCVLANSDDPTEFQVPTPSPAKESPSAQLPVARLKDPRAPAPGAEGPVAQFGELAQPQITWVGFGTSKGPLTGYSPVGGLQPMSYVGADPRCSVTDALKTVRSQLSIINGRHDVAKLVDSNPDRGGDLAATLNNLRQQPRVVTMVLTGPTRSVEFLLESTGHAGFETPMIQLDQDLYNY